MKMSYFKYTLFTLFKLPAAWITGVRLTHLDDRSSTASIKHRWINQNPYSSMFWAVQGMAAEFPTGILLTQEIERSKRNISMLVLNNKASFTKKATGRINFTCNQGEEARATIDKLITTGEPQTVWLDAVGVNESGQQVSSFSFEWTLLLKK
ncbi:DUF4442 domain-containing protein [Flavobacteriaceae bacterium]|nr:DUF4442 domain-containing protein [Flavobacteriaceae bacterium]MDA9184069.1 DUF4442 domain-containing protein [Flavobacteriaceae bacterium]MDA9244610.1 DUF4442 domain-containing protein [Flavobacteriaceae bacterium]MDA9294395.1 DUF4442 domain-containing protein [Flavobacteriaceae bacterium]MDB4113081.1 DUF4442 domain-containing protein [Flavobacteriaceae bacterium]